MLASAGRIIRNAFAARRRNGAAARAPAARAAASEGRPAAIEHWQAILDSQGENAPAAAYLGVGRARRVLGELASAETVIEQGLGDLGLAAERAEIAMAHRNWPQAITRWRAEPASRAAMAPGNHLWQARAFGTGDLAAAGAACSRRVSVGCEICWEENLWAPSPP